MRGFIRTASFLATVGVALVGQAMGGRTAIRDLDDLPHAGNSTLGQILVTDFTATDPPPNPVLFTTCVRDLDNNPVPFIPVTVDFSTCGSNVEVAATQQDPNVTMNCTYETLTKVSDAGGCVVLGPFIARTGINVPGWPTAPGNAPSRNIGPAEAVICAAVYTGGFLAGTASVRIVRYDSDADGDVDAGDRGYTLDAVGHFFGGPPPSPPYRTFYDYDHDGDIDAGDVSAVLDAEALYLQGLGSPYTGLYCP